MKFKPDDIVYFVQRNKWDFRYEIIIGIVLEEFSDGVYVERIHLTENRYINDIPYNEFPTFGKWHKLPKKWTYDAELFEVECHLTKEEENLLLTLSLTKPNDVTKGLKEGILIPLHLKDQSIPHTEIDGRNGRWRIYKESPKEFNYIHPYICLKNKNKIYFTFEEAEAEIKEIEAEIERVKNLSDEEWSKEQIQKDIDRWIVSSNPSPERIEEIKNFIFSLPKIDMVETRVYMGEFQWRYENKKRWVSIVSD